VIPEDVRTNPHAFIEYIREHRIDVLDCTPSHLSTLLEAGLEDGQAGVPSLALIGGEAIDEQLWLKLASSRTTFYNVYGPTECTVDSTAIRVSTDSAVAIGRPLSNVRSYVLNEKMEMVPRECRESCASLDAESHAGTGCADIDRGAVCPRSICGSAGSAAIPHRRPREISAGRFSRV